MTSIQDCATAEWDASISTKVKTNVRFSSDPAVSDRCLKFANRYSAALVCSVSLPLPPTRAAVVQYVKLQRLQLYSAVGAADDAHIVIRLTFQT